MDSSSTASIVCSMCHLVVEAIEAGNDQVLRDVRRVTHDETYTPATPQELANRIFYTMYMGTDNSSDDTRNRAQQLADEVCVCVKSHV